MSCEDPRPQRAPQSDMARLETPDGAVYALKLTALRGSTDGRLTQAARSVLAERARQQNEEGWTPANDDEYDDGQLACAAACYALSRWIVGAGEMFMRAVWPWEPRWWKPSTRRRDLVKAGALILAEIERLDRADAPPDA